MKRILIAQNKGGTGKTTVAKLLAEAFSARKVRTLVLDLDPQCSLSQRFLKMDHDPAEPDGFLPPLHPNFPDADAPDWNGRSSIGSIYSGGDIYAYPTDLPNLDILPGHGPLLRRIELVKEEDVTQQVHVRLNDFLSNPAVDEQYDLCIIDTAPSKGPLTTSAARAASHMLIPCIMEQQSIEGLNGMLQFWRRENRLRERPLEIIGILPNKFRASTSLHAGLLASLKSRPEIAPLVMPMELSQRTAFAEADFPDAKPGSVFELPARDPARKEAEQLFKIVREAVGL